MNILAVDPGSKLGWALQMGAGAVESGVEDFSLRRGESPGARFLRFRRWLQDVDALTIRKTSVIASGSETSKATTCPRLPALAGLFRGLLMHA